MSRNPKAIVAAGYDTVAANYLSWSKGSRVRLEWLDSFIAMLKPGALVLDLGCGAGVPAARKLVDAGMRIVGIDGSAQQVELARRNVPEGSFTTADMTECEVAPASVDAVVALYSIIHVPRAGHGVFFKRIAEWLRPGGLLLASLGAEDSESWQGSWLGTDMYFSHFDADTNECLVQEAGFFVEKAKVVRQDDEDVRFLWIVARRPVS